LLVLMTRLVLNLHTAYSDVGGTMVYLFSRHKVTVRIYSVITGKASFVMKRILIKFILSVSLF
jgi:hypothetical protein